MHLVKQHIPRKWVFDAVGSDALQNAITDMAVGALHQTLEDFTITGAKVVLDLVQAIDPYLASGNNEDGSLGQFESEGTQIKAVFEGHQYLVERQSGDLEAVHALVALYLYKSGWDDVDPTHLYFAVLYWDASVDAWRMHNEWLSDDAPTEVTVLEAVLDEGDDPGLRLRAPSIVAALEALEN